MRHLQVSLIVLLVACGGSQGPVDVHGLVLGGDGQPQEGALVSVAGRPAIQTAADGTFTEAQVQVPYEVIVGLTQTGVARSFAASWQGLTRANPVLALASGWPQPARNGIACGSAAGAAILPSGSRPYVFLEAPGASAALNFVQPDGTWCASARWFGPTQIQAVAHALQVDTSSSPGDTVAVGFPRYGRSAAVTLLDNQTAGNADIALAPLAAGALRVGTSLRSGQTAIFSASVFFGPTGGQAEGIPLAWVGSGPPWPDVAIPAIDGAQISAWIVGTEPAGVSTVQRSFRSGGTIVWNPSLPSQPLPASPPEGATISAGTRFSWTPASLSGVHALEITADQTAGTPLTIIQVIAAGTSAALPDPAAVGVALPAAAQAHWLVRGIGPLATIDELASPERLGMALHSGAGQAEMQMSASAPRGLTFAAK